MSIGFLKKFFEPMFSEKMALGDQNSFRVRVTDNFEPCGYAVRVSCVQLLLRFIGL